MIIIKKGLISCSQDGELLWHRHDKALSPRDDMTPVALDWNINGELAFVSSIPPPEESKHEAV